MSAPAVIPTLFDDPPIYLDRGQVAALTWQGADYCCVVVHFAGGGSLKIPSSSLIELGGRLTTNDEAARLMEWVAGKVWPA